MTFNLTPESIDLSLAWEGPFKPKAWLDNVADPPRWTIGKGLTELKGEDGKWRPVNANDKIDEYESDLQTHMFFRERIEPALSRMFDGAQLHPNQRNALASIVYNAGPGAFPKTAALILSGAPLSDVLDEWVAGEWNNALGLYRRRLTEAIVYGFGWSHENAKAATEKANWSTDWRELVGVEQPSPEPVLFDDDDVTIPKFGAVESRPQPVETVMRDPTPETPLTTMDAQYIASKGVGLDLTFEEFAGLGNDKMLVTNNGKLIAVPRPDPTKPPKPMEKSETFRGLAKQKSGKEAMGIGGTLAAGSATVAAVKELTSTGKDVTSVARDTSDFVVSFTMNDLLVVGLFIGLPLAAYGLWRVWRGSIIAYEGRKYGTQGKV